MYLDSHETDETYVAVLAFYAAQLAYAESRAAKITTRVAQATRLCVIIGLATLIGVVFNSPWWIPLVPIVSVPIVWSGGYWFVKRAWAGVPTARQFGERLAEIAQLDADLDDRQLFLRLIAALRNEDRAEVLSAAAEAARSPTLSQLAFIRELDAIIH